MRTISLLLLAALASFGQTPAPAPFMSVIGTVTTLDAAGKVFGVKTDKSGDTTVKYDDKTAFRRIPPGETDMKKATEAQASDVGVGDRILARVRTENPTGLPANAFYITKHAEITQRDQKKELEWQTQSVAGLVKSVDAAGKQVTLAVRGAAGPARDVAIDFGAASDTRRLNPETLQYEAAAATGIQVGDQVRVLGQKNADVTQVKAEAIMFATLRSIPVTVKSVDVAAGVISATDVGSKKPVSIKINAATSLKKLDDATATMLARRLNPTAAAGGRGRGAADPAAGGAAPGQGGGGRGRGGQAGGDLNKILEQQGPLVIADLKPGDPLIITGAASTDGQKLTATAIVGGVEPILRAAPQNGPDPLGGNWSLGDGPPAQ